VNERQEAGEHQVKWEGLDNSGLLVASGTYFYVVNVGNSIKSQKMILLK
jgi:flagellar hook assembly protein FlgD